MHVIRTNIKVDLDKLLGIYLQLKTKHEERIIDSEIDQKRYQYTCFPGGRAYGMRFQGTAAFSKQDEERIISDGKTVTEMDHLFTERNEKCVSYLNDILDFFVGARRGSFLTLGSGFRYKPHVDRPRDVYRLHVVLTTNPYSYMAYENGELYHIPNDGHVWMTRINVKHSAWNMGDTPRTHFMVKMPEDTWNHYANHSEHTITGA